MRFRSLFIKDTKDGRGLGPTSWSVWVQMRGQGRSITVDDRNNGMSLGSRTTNQLIHGVKQEFNLRLEKSRANMKRMTRCERRRGREIRLHSFLFINTKFINTISLEFLFFLNTLLNTSQPQIFEIFLKNFLVLPFSKQKLV